jgi:acid phosphatase (class A)
VISLCADLYDVVTDSGEHSDEHPIFVVCYPPAPVLERFKDALGVELTPTNAPHLLQLLSRVEKDREQLLAPVKHLVVDGGWQRPFVRFPQDPTCIVPTDMAHHHDEDIAHNLPGTGSYPSGHALLGMVTGLILAEVAPQQGSAVLARGYEFGESRLICGFHYPSDLQAGRIAATALYARLHAESQFIVDMSAARSEVEHARGN